jgi:hypothetical protein
VERVAICKGDHSAGEGAFEISSEDLPNLLLDRVGLQWRQDDPIDDPAALQSSEDEPEGMAATEFVGSIGQDDEDSSPDEAVGQVRDQIERGPISPVDVVDHDEEARIPSRFDQDVAELEE